MTYRLKITLLAVLFASLFQTSATMAATADMDVEISINWTAPLRNTDGTIITDLAGFRVFYGTSSRQYSSDFPIASATQTSTVFNVLRIPSGSTVFVTMTALDRSGNESAYSNEVLSALSSQRT